MVQDSLPLMVQDLLIPMVQDSLFLNNSIFAPFDGPKFVPFQFNLFAKVPEGKRSEFSLVPEPRRSEFFQVLGPIWRGQLEE